MYIYIYIYIHTHTHTHTGTIQQETGHRLLKVFSSDFLLKRFRTPLKHREQRASDPSHCLISFQQRASDQSYTMRSKFVNICHTFMHTLA